MSYEASKALRRRWIEDLEGAFPWKGLFRGNGLDVGCGPDKLPFDDCRGWDLEDGDCNDLSLFFKEPTFDYVHASHVLEHMHDAKGAILSWMKILKKGGFIIGEVPCWELYEGKRSKSIWNPDHKSTWSMWNRSGGPELPHHYAPEFFEGLGGKVNLCRLVDTNYNYQLGAKSDQTFDECDMVECFIEFVIEKL